MYGTQRLSAVIKLLLALQEFPVLIVFNIRFGTGRIDDNLIVLAIAEIVDLIVKEAVSGRILRKFRIRYISKHQNIAASCSGKRLEGYIALFGNRHGKNISGHLGIDIASPDTADGNRI